MSRTQVLHFLLISWTVVNAQFLYNYEQESSEKEEPVSYDPSEYKYNSPSAVEEHFLRTSRSSLRNKEPEPIVYDVEPETLPPQRPRRRQTATNRYRPQPQPVVEQYEPEYRQQPPPEYASEVRTEYVPEERPVRKSRRRPSRRRQEPPVEIVEPPRYYGPSVFENVPLGQPPAGVYVPNDSLLNLLRDDVPRRSQPRAVTSESYAPEVNELDGGPQSPVQEEPSYRTNNNSPFFVHPPSQQTYTRPSSHVPQQQPVSATPVRRAQYNEQPRPTYVSNSQQRPRAAPVQRAQYVEQPEPTYVPTSQEIRQNEYRRQRRIQQAPAPVVQQPPPVRPRPKPRQQARPAPAPQYQEPAPQPVYSDDSSVDYPDDIRRSPRRSQERARQGHGHQVEAVATAPRSSRPRPTFKPANLAIAALPEDTDDDGIPGQAGVDYPTLHVIPTTSFSCATQPHNGYYADLETSCQVVHLCQSGGVQDSFLCPNGTIFSQEKFSCQWWYKVNCQNSPRYYSINDQLYKVPETDKKK